MTDIQPQSAPASMERGRLRKAPENFLDASGIRAVFAEGKNRVSPLVVPRLMLNAPASHLSIRHGLTGPVLAVSSACASANHAMGLALQQIRAGAADVMLTGGAEAMLCFGGVKAWEGLRVLAPDACRPFSLGRKGMVIGEIALWEKTGGRSGSYRRTLDTATDVASRVTNVVES